MRLAARQQQLDALLPVFQPLWHAQPFREARPDWCQRWPALAAELLALDDDAAAALNGDSRAALLVLARHVPEVAALGPLLELPSRPAQPAGSAGERWAWEIPGRKRAQIEAFAAAARPGGEPVLDWCGGKGHLGRLLAHLWQLPVRTLDIDAALCRSGEQLAQRLGVAQEFVAADALATDLRLAAGRHAVALHACGELHRRLIRHGAEQGVARLDVAPCCYHLHLQGEYRPLAAASSLCLTPDDVRLAVTETVTAGARERRQRDRAMASKLAFAAWRQQLTGEAYRNFKPVPEAWMRGSFADFMAQMCRREGLEPPVGADLERCAQRGAERQREVLRLSTVRHAFRRALELWLAGDLAVSLEERGYAAELGVFCARELTPRNLLISARRAG